MTKLLKFLFPYSNTVLFVLVFMIGQGLSRTLPAHP